MQMPGPPTGMLKTMPNQVTQLLHAASKGDAHAAEQVLPLVYESMRQLARQKMAKETPGHTLQPTALVHEAYLRLVKDKNARWQNRAHFFAAAAESMRRILIERARRYGRLKHGGHLERVVYKEASIESETPGARLLALDAALARFETLYPRKAKVVKLRYFVGLSVQETAEALEISPASVKLDWCFARAWLGTATKRNAAPPAAVQSPNEGRQLT